MKVQNVIWCPHTLMKHFIHVADFLKEMLYLDRKILIATVLCSSGSHGVKIILLSDWNIKQPLGFSVISSIGQWGVWHSCWLDVCVSVQGLILCFLQTVAAVLSDSPALFALNRIFHYQIPLLTLHAFCFRAFSFNRQTQLNATKSSSPMWVHSYPSCPLKGMCMWAILFNVFMVSCVSCMKNELYFPCHFYFLLLLLLY